MNELWKKRSDELIGLAAVWACEQEMIESMILVGSYARGECRPDSDIDFCILSSERDWLVRNREFVNRFGVVSRMQTENYGACISVRVWYQDGPEVEFGLVKPDWIALPLDPGTEQVLKDGYRVLVDKNGAFEMPGIPKQAHRNLKPEEEEKMRQIVLASASPRRKQLLEQIGIPYRIHPSQVNEAVTSDIPAEVVEELSFQKCADVLASEPDGTIVLGADTVVSFEGKILGKPVNEKAAFEMLDMLQGKTHQVYTGVTLMEKNGDKIWKKTFHECTDVTFYPVSREELEEYIATGEPMDKAGSYGIQGRFAAFVRGIRGDYNNVVGLPAAAVYQRLKERQKEQKSSGKS